MEEHVSHQEDDGTIETIPYSAETNDADEILDEENIVAGNMNNTPTNETMKQHEKTEILPEQGNDIDNDANEKTKDDQGNLLSNVVTMHMTNCDDEYSPTLAICDIFSNTKTLTENETSTLDAKEDECKDEFLIIDLDTCKMERQRASKKQKGCEADLSENPLKGLVSVNLSSSEEAQSDFLNKGVKRNPSDNQCENNFLHITKDCDSHTSFDQREKSGIGSIVTVNGQCASVEKHKITPLNDDEALHQIELHLPMKSGGMKIDDTFRGKGILFHDIAMSHDSNMSSDNYSADASFHSDINMSLNSNENQECEPVFYMPEVYTKIYDEVKSNDHPSNAFTKMSSLNSSLVTDNCNQYYEYAINDNTEFETLSTSQHNNATTYDFYEQHHTQMAPNYSIDDKSINKMVAVDTKRDTSPTYGFLSRYPENTLNHVYKKMNATCESRKLPCYPSAGEHKAPSFHSSYLPNYPAPYPYNKFQQASDASQQFSSTAVSNYSDWNSWSSSAFYEVNLNSFPSVPNIDSHYYQGKEEWSNDTSIPDLYYDPQVGVKSNQVDNDSEATEDADEIDDVPTFFENSSDFSACDNLSNMSVMSSCYSDSSSVITPFSPSDFTPPPSASNTPIPSGANHEVNTFEERFSGPFMNDDSRTEPIHLYSPTMLSVAPYKLANEKCEQNFVNYDHSQGSKRFYPSMADMHNSRSGLLISSTSSKFEEDEVADCPDYTQSHKSQIQSDKISTSTSRNIFNKQKWIPNTGTDSNETLESFADFMKQEDGDFRNELRKCRHNEPLRQTAIIIMSHWYEEHLDNPYPTKDDKLQMAREGGITVTQVKSWFANKRNRTNNTKPKVQKRAMKEKLKKLFQDLKHSRSDSLDNSHIIQQLSGIIQT